MHPKAAKLVALYADKMMSQVRYICTVLYFKVVIVSFSGLASIKVYLRRRK